MAEKIWRSIDPELFTIVEDLLEDAIQSVSPGIIVSLKKNSGSVLKLCIESSKSI